MKTDFLIIGSGIAGLRAAIELGRFGDVLLVTKDRYFESSSSYAQGGIAVVIADDDAASYHIEDTLKAGNGLCRKKAVNVLIEQGPSFVEELIQWGARFDRNDGQFQIGLEGAHSRRRILHFRDSTGEEIVRVLRSKALENPGISKLPKHFVIDLLISNGRCTGAVLLNEEHGSVQTVTAKATILATGGAGQVYLRTSNPFGATGDGFASAHRGGAVMMDMEFVQFHPTTFALPGAPSFLITEALRGEGALLRNIRKKRFMRDYHPLEELAPRDEVSRAIVSESRKENCNYVLLDATHIRPSVLKERFPTAFSACMKYGLDITKDMIPVSPAAHFMIGGVETDTWGQTSVPGLFAAGEVAATGVHGANRLASNSLLEGLVYGARAGRAAAIYSEDIRRVAASKSKSPIFRMLKEQGKSNPAKQSRLNSFRDQIRNTMWNHAGIIRTGESLAKALMDIDCLIEESGSFNLQRGELEFINMLTTARLIVSSAIKRKESVGAHYREDFPQWNGKVKHIKMKSGVAKRI